LKKLKPPVQPNTVWNKLPVQPNTAWVHLITIKFIKQIILKVIVW